MLERAKTCGAPSNIQVFCCFQRDDVFLFESCCCDESLVHYCMILMLSLNALQAQNKVTDLLLYIRGYFTDFY